jgi:hypothetical protein
VPGARSCRPPKPNRRRLPDSPVERAPVARLVEAFETADVEGIVALMTEDAWLRMPPVPLEYQGRELVGEFFSVVAFRQGRRYRLIQPLANGQPAFAVYLRDPVNGVCRRSGCSWPPLSGNRGQRDHALRQRHTVGPRPAAHPGRLRLARKRPTAHRSVGGKRVRSLVMESCLQNYEVLAVDEVNQPVFFADPP